jgi:hypothetical protein
MAKIIIRKGLATNLPTLNEGEFGLSTDTKELYIGTSGGNYELLTSSGSLDPNIYTLVDGTRPFTGTVGGITPTISTHLSTKGYVDTQISTLSGSIVLAHSGLTGLTVGDDHTQYILATGTRDFSGIVQYNNDKTFTTDQDIVAKKYVDDEITSLSGSIVLAHSGLTGLTVGDDHTQYILVNGSRGFTSTVSGVSPVSTNDLATKSYVDAKLVIEEGNQTIVNGSTSVAVTLSGTMDDTDYSLTYSLRNVIDSEPAQYGMITTTVTTSGFTVHFSDPIDGDNYYLSWRATDNATNGGGGGGGTTDHSELTNLDYASAGHTGFASTADLSSKLENVVEDTTPQLGGDLELNEHNIVYGATPTSSGSYEGDIKTVSITGSETLVGDPLYVKSDGKFEIAIADAAATMPCRAMAVEEGIGTKKVLFRGQICNSDWSWTVGGNIYVGSSTVLTQTPPASSGDVVQIIGYAISSTAIYFNPEYSMIVIA